MHENGILINLQGKDMIEDPHFTRDAIIDIEHPEFGLIKMQMAPKLSKSWRSPSSWPKFRRA